jgi:hypothetical protein
MEETLWWSSVCWCVVRPRISVTSTRKKSCSVGEKRRIIGWRQAGFKFWRFLKLSALAQSRAYAKQNITKQNGRCIEECVYNAFLCESTCNVAQFHAILNFSIEMDGEYTLTWVFR